MVFNCFDPTKIDEDLELNPKKLSIKRKKEDAMFNIESVSALLLQPCQEGLTTYRFKFKQSANWNSEWMGAGLYIGLGTEDSDLSDCLGANEDSWGLELKKGVLWHGGN